MVEAGLILCRWLHYIAVTSLFGLSLFSVYAPGATIARAVPPRSVQVLAACALVSGLAWLFVLAASVGGGFDQAWTALPLLLTGADFGPIWLARLAFALALCLPVLRTPGLRALTSAVLLASIALTGHARTHEGPLGQIQIIGDALHLLAAGAWLGALAGFLALLATAPEDPETVRALATFSGVGMSAVAILLVTGTVNAWLILPEPTALASTLYGRLLAAKVGLFALMVAFAAHNRLKLVPALESAPKPGLLRALRRNILCEQALGLAVLAVVAAIGALDPSL